MIAFKTAGVRINVYYTTGTVGTYLDHPRMGKTQLFRRGVDLTLLEVIMRNPRTHTDLGYHFKSDGASSFSPGNAGGRGAAGNRGRRRSPRRFSKQPSQTDSEFAVDVDEETAAKQQLERLKTEQKALQKEIAAAQAIVDGFEEERKKEAEEKARIEREAEEKAEAEAAAEQARLQTAHERWQRGRSFAWAGLREPDFVESIVDSTATCVAIGGHDNACLVIYEDGGFSYTGGLPTPVHNKLHSRPAHAPKPVFAALGTEGRYFMEFTHGTNWIISNVPGVLNIVGENSHRGGIASVSFGEDYETYFIVWKDGWWSRNGDIPSGLAALMSERRNKSDLDFVSIGPTGEWFLRARNGRAWWGGDAVNMIDDRYTNSIRNIVFGDGGYLMRYNN
eukprot:TRINITY_DN74174_c0_g1_i1.p1 TRINITY_DN74174_c0_g1~~TRINITY_DN74174_c0_g1_i1.p1  ORF type:complete len:430 (-),score=54.07 TRINITY_DN74174_c0_g1_i1:90-1265(-)